MHFLCSLCFCSFWVAADVSCWADALSSHLVEHCTCCCADRMTAVLLCPAFLTLTSTLVGLKSTLAVARTREFVLSGRTARVTGFANGPWTTFANCAVPFHTSDTLATVGAHLVILGVTRALVLTLGTEEAFFALACGLVTDLHALTLIGTRISSFVNRACDIACSSFVRFLAAALGSVLHLRALAIAAAWVAILTKSWAPQAAVVPHKAIKTLGAFRSHRVVGVWEQGALAMTRARVVVVVQPRARELASVAKEALLTLALGLRGEHIVVTGATA